MLFKPKDIVDIAAQLKQGAVGVFPCDTLLGIVALPTPASIARIQQLKQRPNTPFLMLLPDTSHLKNWTAPIDASRMAFLNTYWPGPVTGILPKHPSLEPELTAGKPGIGLRIPNFVPLNFLLEELNSGLLSTSLNRHGQPAAQHISDCPQDLLDEMDFVYNAISPRHQTPSTIVDPLPNPPQLIRQGKTQIKCLSYPLEG